MGKALAIAGALGMVLVADAAAAQMQRTAIAAPADEPYRFRHSGIVTPPVLDGMPRTGIEQYGDDQLDVFARYERGSDAITVYVYRSTSGSVPVWFDRAQAAVEGRSAMFGTATPAVPPTAFAAPGRSDASGLMAAWSVSKPPYRGTALAILPVGEWLVKIRYSSTTLDGAGVAARLPVVLAALEWPKGIAPQPAAAPIADCATPLAFPTVAEPVRDGKALSVAALTGGLLAAAPPSATGGEKGQAATWCRDPAPARVGAAYRPGGSGDSYLLAFSDAGRGIFVAPDAVGRELAQADGRTANQWRVALIEPGTTTSYAPMTALPRPDQVIDALNGSPLSRTSTWGGKINVDINSAVLK